MQEQAIGKMREGDSETFICPTFSFGTCVYMCVCGGEVFHICIHIHIYTDHGVMFKEFEEVGAFIYFMVDTDTLPMGMSGMHVCQCVYACIS
jgi:hypothetical protein